MAGDAGGCCGDAVPGGQDGGGGLGARVGAGPAGRVGQAAGGGDAVAGAGDPGDRVGFGLAQADAAGGGGPGRVAGIVVQQQVAELVRQCPHRLLVADPGGMRMRRAAQNTVPSGGGPCSARPRIPRGGPASTGHPTRCGRIVPRANGGVADGRPGGLGQVPDVGNPLGLAPDRFRLVLVLVLALCAPAAAGWRRSRYRSGPCGPAFRPRSTAGSPGQGWRRAAGRG